MQVMVRTKGFELTNAIDNHIRHRAQPIQVRFRDIIRKIEVYVSDENGPKGGIDKSCVVKIRTDNQSELVVKETEANAYLAITKALARARQALTRQSQKLRRKNHVRIATQLEEASETLAQQGSGSITSMTAKSH